MRLITQTFENAITNTFGVYKRLTEENKAVTDFNKLRTYANKNELQSIDAVEKAINGQNNGEYTFLSFCVFNNVADLYVASVLPQSTIKITNNAEITALSLANLMLYDERATLDKKQKRKTLALLQKIILNYVNVQKYILCKADTLVLLTALCEAIQGNTAMYKVPITQTKQIINKIGFNAIDFTSNTQTYKYYNKEVFRYYPNDNKSTWIEFDKDRTDIIISRFADCKKLLDILCFKYKLHKSNDYTVELPFAEFMRLYGLKDQKEAKDKMRECIDALKCLIIKYSIDTSVNFIKDVRVINEHTKSRTYVIELNKDLCNEISNTKAYYLINENAFMLSGNAYSMYRKMIDNYVMTYDNGNEKRILKIKTLLKSTSIISYAGLEAQGHGRNHKDRIIKPFINAIKEIADAKVDITDFCFADNDGNIIDVDLIKRYDVFENLLINYTVNPPKVSRGVKSAISH